MTPEFLHIDNQQLQENNKCKYVLSNLQNAQNMKIIMKHYEESVL